VTKIFTGPTTPLPWPTFLVTRMLTRDLFAVVNLAVTSANDLTYLFDWQLNLYRVGSVALPPGV